MTDTEKQRTIIVDIDGTVADTSRREHLLQKNPQDWESFFETAKEDLFVPAIQKIGFTVIIKLTITVFCLLPVVRKNIR